MLLATINSSIILIALDIFRRIHLDPLTPANTNYLLRTTACLLVGWASVPQCALSERADGSGERGLGVRVSATQRRGQLIRAGS